MSATSPIFCTNHPKTETLLRCNKCGRPFCVRCLERMPVGYRCRERLNQQQVGYYTATPVDYVITAVIALVASVIGAAIAFALSGIFLLAIFYGPFAGGIIAEVIRRPIQKRRGRYIGLLASAMVVLGGLVIIGFPLVFALLFPARIQSFFVGTLGFWIYLVLAVSTVYARLR